jgi:predicted deacylase
LKKKVPIHQKKITTKYQFIRLVTGTDLSKRRIPFMMIDSGNPGPVVWMTACIHGDEISGTVIIQELFKLLRREICLGKLYAFPIVNPFGFEQKSRFIPYSKEDLNRLFPGNEKGSLGERIAAIIFKKIIQTNPTLVLDLHNDWIRSIPYTLIDRDYIANTNADIFSKLNTYACTLEFPVVLDTEKITGNLSAILLNRGIPALTLELGASNFVSEENIKMGVSAITRLLKHLGMLKVDYAKNSAVPTKSAGEFLFYSQLPLSSTSGIIRFYTEAGRFVQSGQVIAKIYNAFGKAREVLVAENDALVLGCSDTSLAFPGFPVMAFGIRKVKDKIV